VGLAPAAAQPPSIACGTTIAHSTVLRAGVDEPLNLVPPSERSGAGDLDDLRLMRP
jgi:hypothetical protein